MKDNINIDDLKANISLRDSSIKEDDIRTSLSLELSHLNTFLKTHSIKYEENLAGCSNSDVDLDAVGVNYSYDVSFNIENDNSIEDIITNLTHNAVIPFYRKENISDTNITSIDGKLLVNRSNKKQLEEIPTLRMIHVKKILELRSHGRFINSFDDLANLIGIDNDDIIDLRKYIIIDKKTSKNGGRILDL